MTAAEQTWASESDAHAARRTAILSGLAVSLIAFDPSREVFAFDIYR